MSGLGTFSLTFFSVYSDITESETFCGSAALITVLCHLPTGAAALTPVGLGRKTKCRLTFRIFDCTFESQIALREHSKKCYAGSALTPTLISKNDELVKTMKSCIIQML